MTVQRLTIDRLNDRGCLNMLCTMVHRMSKGFRKSYAAFLKNPSDHRSYKRYLRLRDDFLSEDFSDITGLDGAKIVAELEEIVECEVSPLVAALAGQS